MKRYLNLLLAFAASAVLMACGGGGGGTVATVASSNLSIAATPANAPAAIAALSAAPLVFPNGIAELGLTGTTTLTVGPGTSTQVVLTAVGGTETVTGTVYKAVSASGTREGVVRIASLDLLSSIFRPIIYTLSIDIRTAGCIVDTLCSAIGSFTIGSYSISNVIPLTVRTGGPTSINNQNVGTVNTQTGTGGS